MRRRAVAAIAKTDLTVALRSRGVRLPILLAPIVALGVLPALIVVVVWFAAAREAAGLDTLGSFAPRFESWGMAGADVEQFVGFVLESLFAPIFVLVPLVVAVVIAADSFAGERDRGTLEALLNSSASEEELLSGKFLAAWIPAVGAALVGFLLYMLVANILALPFETLSFPTMSWVLLAVWVAPGVAGLGLGLMVVVSSRVDSLQAAHQLGALAVIPVMLLLIVQVVAAIEVSARLVAASGAAVWIVVGLLAIVARRLFRRDRLAAQL